MLKKILINQKLIPVPVPLKTMREALEWVENTLIRPGQSITRVTLNGRSISGERLENRSASELSSNLDDKSKLEFQVDTPADLAIQTLEAIHNLAAVVLGGLKAQAVTCWQARPNERPPEVETVHGDVVLMLDLLEHLRGLVDESGADMAALSGIATMMNRVEVGIGMAKSNSDWKACARLLLNRLEPLLKDLVAESETLQIKILATRGPRGAMVAEQG